MLPPTRPLPASTKMLPLCPAELAPVRSDIVPDTSLASLDASDTAPDA